MKAGGASDLLPGSVPVGRRLEADQEDRAVLAGVARRPMACSFRVRDEAAVACSAG